MLIRRNENYHSASTIQSVFLTNENKSVKIDTLKGSFGLFPGDKINPIQVKDYHLTYIILGVSLEEKPSLIASVLVSVKSALHTNQINVRLTHEDLFYKEKLKPIEFIERASASSFDSMLQVEVSI